MLYHNSRPAFSRAHKPASRQFYQWRDFPSAPEEIIEKIEARFESKKKETRTDRYFLVPGRSNVMPRLVDDERFELRTLLDGSDPVELWERTVTADFPLQRTKSAMIGQAVPRFRGALSSVATPETLTEALSKKSKLREVTKERHVLTHNDVTAEISYVEVDGEKSVSIALQSADEVQLKLELRTLGLDPSANTNYNAFLSAV